MKKALRIVFALGMITSTVYVATGSTASAQHCLKWNYDC